MTPRPPHDQADSELLLLVDSFGSIRRFVASAASGPSSRVAAMAVDALLEQQELDGCAVYLAPECLAGPAESSLVLETSTGLAQPLLDLTAELAETAVRTGQPYYQPDLARGGSPEHGSLMVLPVATRTKRLGALAAWSGEPFRFRPWHEHLAGLFCDVLSLALVQGMAPESEEDTRSPADPQRQPRFEHCRPVVDRAPVADRSSSESRDENGLDPLTGLLSRSAFESQLRVAISEGMGHDQPLYLYYVDVDRYRLIRECGGDQTADRVIRILADILRCQFDRECILGRLGSDEFGVAARIGRLDDALDLAQRLIDVVDALRMSYAGQRYDISISIGLVPSGPGRGAAKTAMQQARAACHAVQRQGGGAAQVYSPTLSCQRRSQDDGRMLNQLTCALKEDRLLLYAQPIVPARQGSEGQSDAPSFFEILLRMRNKRGDLFSAGAFLPLAERYGLSVKLDRWVIQESFRRLSCSESIVTGGAEYALNLSGHSIDDHRLLDFIVDQLRETGLPPERVCFEITETAAISDIDSAKTFIRVLKEIGCKFALDDFGSGHSSFLYLRDLEVDYLKIEGHLVRDITRDPVSHAFVRSIGDIGKIMGKRTIAEHVESDDVLDAIMEIGIDFAQGYLVGRPEPLSRWLA